MIDAASDFSVNPRDGWDYLRELKDDVGIMTDLFKALSLIGDGIGGEVGFAVSQVADQALQAASNATGCVEAMLHQRGRDSET